MIRSWLVEGMDCSGCKATIERSLAKVPGVESGQVNFLSRRLTVTFDERTTSADHIGAAVERLGFAVTPESPQAEEVPSPVRPSPVWWNARAKQVVTGTAFVALAACAAALSSEPRVATVAWSLASLLAGVPVFTKAWKSARGGAWFSIETLMTVATFGAVAIGAAGEASMVVLLFLVGEWLESVAAAKARANISALLSLAPSFARKVDGNTVRDIPLEALAVGDVVEVRPGDRVPTDGLIVTGTSALDESLLTGESLPVTRGPGEPLTAGTLNAEGLLRFRVTKTTRDNTLARILHLVEEAESRKSPAARFIDTFSQRYTPVVFAAALGVAILPPLLVPTVTFETSVYRALGLLLIGCPCALVLSVPAAVTAAIAQGARRGLLVKGGAALEALGTATHVAFDKTGTLTHGRPELVAIHAESGETEASLLRLVARVEASSPHPLAKALVAAARARTPAQAGAEAPNTLDAFVTQARVLPGEGMEAIVDGRTVAVLSPRAAAARCALSPAHRELIASHECLAQSVVVVVSTPGSGLKSRSPQSQEATVLGVLALADTLRAEAPATLARLRALGLHLSVLTGDNRRAGDALGATLGVDVRSELSPEGKLQALTALKAKEKVVMVGDGLNDAPALAAADIGIAMSLGTDVALESADAVLHADSLSGVADILVLARRARRIVRQNIAVALGLKGLFLGTTLLGLTGLWLAVLSDTGATVLVTLNALRLLKSDEA